MMRPKSLSFLSQQALNDVFTGSFHYLSQLIDKFEINHYLTRRLALVSAFMALFGLFNIIVSRFDPGLLPDDPLVAIIQLPEHAEMLKALNPQWVDISVVCMVCLIFVFNGLIPIDKIESDSAQFLNLTKSDRRALIEAKKKLLKVCVYLFTVLVLIGVFLFNWKGLSAHYLFWGLLGMTISLVVNRKLGYTRAWSRNRLTSQRLEILYAEWQRGLDSEDNIRYRLYQLLEKNSEDAHDDIVGGGWHFPDVFRKE